MKKVGKRTVASDRNSAGGQASPGPLTPGWRSAKRPRTAESERLSLG